jgi:hypothetical protein
MMKNSLLGSEFFSVLMLSFEKNAAWLINICFDWIHYQAAYKLQIISSCCLVKCFINLLKTVDWLPFSRCFISFMVTICYRICTSRFYFYWTFLWLGIYDQKEF